MNESAVTGRPGESFLRRFRDIIADTVDSSGHGARSAGSVSMAGPHSAVVVEDDRDIRILISEILEQAGFTVHAAASGLEGIKLVTEHQPVVTTLDVSMPGMDGFETAKRIRAVSGTYIVMLTARADEIDTLQGLQSGADDYITKPFRPRELRARVEAMLRRPRAVAAGQPQAPSSAVQTAALDHEANGWLSHRGLRLHRDMRVTSVGDMELELTRSEFDILYEIMYAGRRVVSKRELVLALRGDEGHDYVSEHDTRTIEVHVANLRRKLGESAADPQWIETLRGVGYRLTAS